MSSFYTNYKDINGSTAFLAGNISALSDETLCKILPRYWAAETDVFETDIENLVPALKNRFQKYNNDETQMSELIENLKFEVEECKDSFEQILHSLFDSYKEKHSSEETENIKEFLSEIRFQIGDIEAIYRLKQPLSEKSSRCLSEYYTYIIFDIIFIKYSGYIVMVVLGSDE